MLGNLLNQHPDVAWGGEIFQMPSGRDHAGPGLIDWLARARTRPGKRVVGLELKPWFSRFTGWPMQDLIQGMRERFDLRMVTLRRRNLLRSLVSAAVAEARQTYHLYGEVKAELAPIRLDPAKVLYGDLTCSLLEQLERLELFDLQIERLSRAMAPLRLTYEDDVQDSPLRGYELIRRHAGLGEFRPQVRLSRTTPFPLSAVVENWSEIRGLLSGLRYARFCEGE